MAGVTIEGNRAVVEKHKKCIIKCNIGRLDREDMECGHFQDAKNLVDDGRVQCAICPKFVYAEGNQTLL